MAKKEKAEKKDYQKEYEEIKDLLQRTQADFVNFKRRNEEDRVNFIKLAGSDLIEQILPVMDNFALAAKHVPAEIEQNSWVVGIKAIEKQLEQVLLSNGLEKVEVVGQDFDPNIHEAIAEETDKDQKDGVVLREESSGYRLNGKLIRPAKVIVNKVHDGITK
jgi:molecular chaperone GrpE